MQKTGKFGVSPHDVHESPDQTRELEAVVEVEVTHDSVTTDKV